MYIIVTCPTITMFAFMASEFHVIFEKQKYRKPIKPRSFVNRSSFVFFTSNSYVMKKKFCFEILKLPSYLPLLMIICQ